jgi:hypothetical protein
MANIAHCGACNNHCSNILNPSYDFEMIEENKDDLTFEGIHTLKLLRNC